jgi:hypothetical protein
MSFIDCLVVHPSLASEVVLCESVTQRVAFYRVRIGDFSQPICCVMTYW